ncbi:MAG: EF-hand domain-containing protein [Candidatus Riflebacteria bacterium]|nr:EF-hand domain-containing protein [Candidatus Riflebacteria bacterium]
MGGALAAPPRDRRTARPRRGASSWPRAPRRWVSSVVLALVLLAVPSTGLLAEQPEPQARAVGPASLPVLARALRYAAQGAATQGERNPGQPPPRPGPIGPVSELLVSIPSLEPRTFALRRHSLARPGPAIRMMFRRFDVDGDGSLTEPEWRRFVRDPSNLPFDADGDGRISLTEFARAVFDQNPSTIPVYSKDGLPQIFRARQAAAQGELVSALDMYVHALYSRLDFAQPYLGMGRVLSQLDRPVEAALAYHRSLDLDPTQAETWLNLALLEYRRGRFPAAQHALSTGLRLLETAAGLKGGWTSSAFEKQHVLHVAAALRDLLLRAVRLPEVAARVEQWMQTQVVWRPVAAPPLPPQMLLTDLWTRLRAEDSAGAMKVLAELHSRLPGDWNVYLLESWLLRRGGRPLEAETCLEQAGRLGAPSSPLGLGRLAALLARGAYRDADNLSETLLNRGLETPGMAELAWELATVGRWKTAVPLLEELLDCGALLDGAIPMARAVGALAQGDRNTAIRTLQEHPRPLRSGPRLLELHASLCLRLGLHSRALESASEAVELNGRSPALWTLLARAQWARGLQNEALASLRKAWGMYPPAVNRKELLEVLEAWLGSETGAPAVLSDQAQRRLEHD